MKGPGWPDTRGWLAIGLFFETNAILLMIWLRPSITDNEFFKLIAQAIVVQGFLTTILSAFFSSTRNNGELASKALDVAHEQARSAPALTVDSPATVRVEQPFDLTEEMRVRPEAR